MPQAIPVIAAIAANAYPAYAGWIALAAAAASYATSQHQKRKAARQARDAYNNSQQDRLVMTSTANGARSRIYGECRNVDGVIFKGTHGANSQFYTLVVALAGHECESIEKVYFNDQELELESDGAGGYWVMTAPYLRNPVRSNSETVSLSGGAGSITLAYEPNAGSVSVIIGEGGYQVPYSSGGQSITLSGSTVTVSGFPGWASGEVLYQYTADDPKARVWKYLGTSAQDIGSDLLASRFPTLINTGTDPNTGLPNDDRFAGICALVVELEYDQDAFPTGLPNVTALVKGARVLDPRDDTTAWTQNPSLIARDWARYSRGGACTAAEVPDAMVEAAANACDTSTDFETPSGTETRPLYQCDIVCRLDVPPDQHLDEIVESMAGKQGWSGGALRWVAGTYRAPVADITEDWVTDAESIVLVPQPARADLVNVYRPSIFSAEPSVEETTGQTAAYTLLPLQEVRSAEFITADGEELPSEITLGGVQHNVHAQHICGVLMRDAHEGLVIKLPCNMRAWVLELFDTVTLTLPTFGFDATELEVIGWTFSVEKGVILTLKMTSAAIFDPDAEFADIYASPNSSLVLPWVVPGIENFTVEDAPEDGTQQSRALCSWGAIAFENVRQSGSVEVQYREVTTTYSDDDWRSWLEAGSSVSTIVPGLRSGSFYIFRARAVNTLGVRGEWCTQVLYSPSVPLVDTDQLAPGSVTDVVQGTLDTSTYSGGYVGDLPGQVDVTPTTDCRLIVSCTGTLRATNSTGGALVVRTGASAGYSVVAGGSGSGNGGGGAVRRSVAAGETWEQTMTCTFSFDADAGVTYGCGMSYSDHISATLVSELTNILVRVEVIKR